ncbi:MAG: winged helix-turn-helix domain-containing protein [Nitrosopumilaceae archaeon]
MAVQDIRVNTRRDQITIMSDLLQIVQQPQRLTHILYRSNMSYGQLVKYLTDMIDLEMVEEKNDPYRAFTITSKGKIFLQILTK